MKNLFLIVVTLVLISSCQHKPITNESPADFEADRYRWYNDMISVFNKNNIASANWNYKSGQFGLIDGKGVKNEPMIEAILKK